MLFFLFSSFFPVRTELFFNACLSLCAQFLIGPLTVFWVFGYKTMWVEEVRCLLLSQTKQMAKSRRKGIFPMGSTAQID